jgi:D-inositol-3-phosphate glycosyltransferase
MPIAVLLSEHSDQYDAIRNPNGGLLNRLATLIYQKAFSLPTDIRGHIVASETLVEAIINSGTMDCELVVQSHATDAAIDKLKRYIPDGLTARKVGVTTLPDLISHGVDEHEITAWFAPISQVSVSIGAEFSQHIRQNYSSKVYPVTLLAHGLSVPWLLYNHFLKILLAGTFPCDSIICSSRASREAARKIVEHVQHQFNRQFGSHIEYNGRFDLIPLCINTNRLYPRDRRKVRYQLGLPKDAFIILLLGRLSPLKADLYPFLGILKSLVANNPQRQILWVMAGTEENGYTPELRRCAAEMGIADSIKIMLNISDATKELLLPAANIFVSASDTIEGSFGLAPVEAMACGVPQVAPDWNGYRDTVLHGQTGFLVPTYWTKCDGDLTATGAVLGWMFDHVSICQSVGFDLGKTVEYLQCLIDNDQLRNEMGRQSRERALSLYSFGAVVTRYEELWRELSVTAKRLEHVRQPVSFDKPLYFNFFGHYASAPISDDTLLHITPRGRGVAKAGSNVERGIVSVAKRLDECTLLEILALLEGLGDSTNRQHARLRHWRYFRGSEYCLKP